MTENTSEGDLSRGLQPPRRRKSDQVRGAFGLVACVLAPALGISGGDQGAMFQTDVTMSQMDVTVFPIDVNIDVGHSGDLEE